MSTDYTNIAEAYDHAHFRAVTEPDSILGELLRRKKKGIVVLELGCGTGSYIIRNRGEFPEVFFVGVDLCKEMIKVAKRKGVNDLVLCDISRGLPIKKNSVDYVVCRFAFHHFTNKDLVLDEIQRCLKGDGTLRVYDVEPHINRNWWIYCLFPEVVAIDKKRFWELRDIINSLVFRGYSVRAEVESGIEIMSKKKIIERLKIKDTSQLYMVSEDLYRQRFAEIEKWPEMRTIRGDYVFVDVTAVKTPEPREFLEVGQR